MSNADQIFWRRFGAILVTMTLFGFVVAFIARSIAGDAHQISMNKPEAVAARIAPMGEARVGDPSKVVAAAPKVAAAPAAGAATTAGAVDAEQIYNTTCMACHAAGVAGAPKKGDEAAWAPRIATGEDAMLKSVVDGKGAMPAKAGNPNLTDEQILAAIRFLTGTADSSATATAKDAAATETTKEVTAGTAATETKKEAPAATAAAEAPKEATAGAAATETTKEATASAASAPAAAAGKPGKEVYAMACVACHATGAANAPKLNDKAAWEPRAATGFAALMSSVTKGKGAMPPRGGLANLSDADVENAVRYMLKEAGVEAGG